MSPRVLSRAALTLAIAAGTLADRPRPHPPLTIGVVAAALGAMFRVPIVYDVQDIWPDEAVMSGILREGRLV